MAKEERVKMKQKELYLIVVTGGPCAGKTTALSFIRGKLIEFGIKVFLVEEVATHFKNAGINLTEYRYPKSRQLSLQKRIFLTQLTREEEMLELARLHPAGKKVVICDRGIMDPVAYSDSPEELKAAMNDLGYNVSHLRDTRYDMVVHLVTTAIGAEEAYNLENPARWESLEQARERDKKIQDAWMRSDHFKVISNFEVVNGQQVKIDFQQKAAKLLQEICLAIGIPAPLEIERKFLLKPGIYSIPCSSLHFAIQQTYLKKKQRGIQRRVRAKHEIDVGALRNPTTYTYTEKHSVKPGIRIEEERQISEEEYLILFKEKKNSTETIQKTRTVFVWEGQYFQMDVIHHPYFNPPIILLEIELTSENQEFILPPFLEIEGDVTDDKRYSNASIAAGKCPGYMEIKN